MSSDSETPWYSQTLNEFLSSLDTSGWPDTAKRAVAPIDSFLMWNKLRDTPGGEELHDRSPSPLTPLLRGVSKYVGNLVRGNTELPVELQYPGSSALGRYGIHIPFVDPEGVQSPRGVQFQHDAPDLQWLLQSMSKGKAPADVSEKTAPSGLHYNLSSRPWSPTLNKGMIDFVANQDPYSSPETLIKHEAGGHGTVDLLTKNMPPSMTDATRTRFYNRLPYYERQELKNSPNPTQAVGENLLERTPEDAPQWSGVLKNTPAYQNVPPHILGDEILAFTSSTPQERLRESGSPDLADEAQQLKRNAWRRAFYRTAPYQVHPRSLRQPGEFTWNDVKRGKYME